MSNAPYIVHVIVNPSYGTQLHNLPLGEPSWVIDSEINHPIIQDIWKSRCTSNVLDGITLFKYDPEGSPESWLLGELETIDLHHGEYSHEPPYSVLNVIGTVCSDSIRKELMEYGFVKYEVTQEGFIALKVNDRVKR